MWLKIHYLLLLIESPHYKTKVNIECDNLKRVTLNMIKTLLPRGLEFLVSTYFNNASQIFHIIINQWIVPQDC